MPIENNRHVKIKYLYKFNLVACLFILLMGTACTNRSEEADVVARVGKICLTRQDLSKQLVWEGFTPEQKNQYIERWINREVLFQEAQRLGLENSEELALELELVKKNFLIKKLLERTFLEKILVDEEMVNSYYNKHEDLFKIQEDQVHLLHILTATREDANLARQAIQAGKAFNEVAKEYSTGIFKVKGGDMGFISKNDVIPEVRRIAFGTRIGGLSRVLKSDYGYHLLQVVDKWKKDDLKPLESVHEEIVARLKASKERQVYFDLLYQLQNKNQPYVASPGASDSL
ncbi:peptidyl-prolyl cis-trans isomerase [bacterium]|nr:peptidyl-prolyl cis-trans isomerase [bacterium]